MNEVIEFVKNIDIQDIVDLWIAFAIWLVFRILSSGISYAIIRVFKLKAKSSKEIKKNAFYDPLRMAIRFLGLYLAILYLRIPIGFTDTFMNLVTKVFKIALIIVTANGLANSLTAKSMMVKKLKQKINDDVDDNMLNFVLKVAKVIIYIIAGFLSITELGFNLNGVVAGLGVGGVIVTLAAQDTAKNLFAGLVIFLDKSFLVGDWIQLGEYEGIVEDLTFRSTRVRTFDNSVVNIPNTMMADSAVINWSRMEKRRYKMNLVLELDTPLEKVEMVKDQIHKMLESRDNVMDDSIIVKFDQITDNGINLLIYAYTDSVDYQSFLTAKEKINYKIMQILDNANVSLAYNTQTVHLKN